MISALQPSLGSPDYSTAVYPNPPSHDFCVWLIIAEAMRRYYNAPPPLKVRFAFVGGQLGFVDFAENSIMSGRCYQGTIIDPNYSTIMVSNVLRPAIDMIGAVELPAVELQDPATKDIIWHSVEYDYHTRNIVDIGRARHQIPKWKPPLWAHKEVEDFLQGHRPITITLREADHQPERNSNIKEWMRFAEAISSEHPILFIRDTAKANSDWSSLFPTWARASTNVYVRAALYQHAFVNMMVSNGPVAWCMFSDAPYLFFKQLVPALPNWEHGQPSGWPKFEHLTVGEQYPWANPRQRVTWLDDTFDNLNLAFHEIEPLL